MSVSFPASVTCDRCGVTTTTIRVAVTKLKPQSEMHLKMPAGWCATSLPESGELFITCPTCPPTLVSIPPVPIVNEIDVVDDPATDPTLRPPPLPKL